MNERLHQCPLVLAAFVACVFLSAHSIHAVDFSPSTKEKTNAGEKLQWAYLGMDHEKLTYRYAGRDFRLTDVEGEVQKDILA